ncbi:tRNA 2-thiouridine synthesizing protein C [Nicoletella semolina]|uniref:tRNA 2-thiouridine synthesizing protein C n=1 Tax=Nicoletella semolina TaxID=271160 RepID=A0A4R2N6Z5_9PAST|nr:sulfurtransferase complex subunit TusC [Nicoletella semolina]MDH2924689.1 sulfurtransferase [Nicoletella semolina]TCP16687.1 tRNA 2-thiouridine synthesizing protein C [Nicoletella semolina]
MKRYKLAVIFTQPPFGNTSSREGLDALLAASAFCNEDEIAVCFMHDGVFNLLADQAPQHILQKDHIAMFKLLDLYDLNERFICQESINQRQLHSAIWLLNDVKSVSTNALFDLLRNAEKILTF